MKFLALLPALALASTAAFGAYTGPLISKTNSGGGPVPLDYVRSESCELYKNKVVITKRFGAQTLVETRSISLGGNLADVISRASTEVSQQSAPGPCDGPSSQIKAFQVSSTGVASEVLLYTSAICGNTGEERSGSASQILRDMIDAYCPATH